MCLPLLLFSLFFGLPLFHVLFLCLSLSLSLSLYLSLSLSLFVLSSFLAVFHVNFWFLLFVFVLFVFCFKMWFCFCFSAWSLVLFWIIILDLFSFASWFLVVLFFCFCCFGILLFLLLATPFKNVSQKVWYCKKMKMLKTDILTGTISTDVLSNSVSLCFFKFCMFCWKHYKGRGFNKKQSKTQQKKMLKTGPRLCLNWCKYVAQQNWTSF